MYDQSIVKVFTIKDGKHHYYVQEMPEPWTDRRVYRIMKDRRIMVERTYTARERAVAVLLCQLATDYGCQLNIDL